MRVAIFYIFSTLNSACTSHMFLFLTIFTLGNTQIYISISNSGDVATNVEAHIDEAFGFGSRLNVPDVDLNNEYIRFWRNFNDSQS